MMNALGGIDPMIACAAKTIALTVLDLLEQPTLFAEAKAEFEARTGGGIGGSKWIPPLCDYQPPLNLCWPAYVRMPRGRGWVIPA